MQSTTERGEAASSEHQRSEEQPLRVIEPETGWVSLNLEEVWRYRDLLFLLVWRDIASRYRQSVVGYGWAVIKPALSMLIFTLVFGKVVGLPSDGVPYPIFNMSALLPWMFFAGSLTSITASVVCGAGLVNKVYFPRLILPLSGVAAGLSEIGIQAVLLGILMAWYGFVPGWTILLAPAFIFLAIVAALAFGLWLTAFNVKYRDVGMAVPFLLQIWMWLCPIVYSSRMVPEKWRLLYGLNPLVGVIEGFRWSVLGGAPPDWGLTAASFVVVAVLFVSGLYYFRRAETSFADII